MNKLIDPADLRLLDLLQHDASLTNLALAHAAGLSPATCLRRVQRLEQAGLIERRVAILSGDKLAPLLGHGLEAIVEVTLERQGEEALAAFESMAAADPGVTQCYRVSPGPDFVLHVRTAHMPGYLVFQQRLLTAHANVRNVKAYFSTRRTKFETKLPLAPVPFA